ncbi:hypothetical protein TYRP_004986 [Tyrophagus putrescentiae]|nr:hypothetical protein TYRP_004986 [Tyrophagus putrescentiae]
MAKKHITFQSPIFLEIKNFSQTTTVVASLYEVINPKVDSTLPAILEASFIPVGWNSAYANKSSIHMHPSQVVAPSEDVKHTKIKHRFYFVKPNGKRQFFHEQKMLLYKNSIHEEILITIDKSFYQDNINELILDDDTLKFCIEPELVLDS